MTLMRERSMWVIRNLTGWVCEAHLKHQLDGEKITELNIQEYRKHLALVSQEPTLYSGTVRFNILLGAIKPHDQVTQEEIENACRDANILEFIEGLPKYVIEFCRLGMFLQLISLVGLKLRSVERAHSYLVDKNVSICICSDDSRFIFLPKNALLSLVHYYGIQRCYYWTR